MENLTLTRIRGTVTALILALVSIVGVVSARAQTTVSLTFTGGGGSAPVTVSWSSPIIYTLNFTSPNSGVNPYFVFRSIPNGQAAFPVQGAVGGTAPTYTGTGTGSSDGLQTINSMYAATTGAQNAVAANDFVFVAFGDTAATTMTAGDVITLSAGSLVYSSGAAYSGVLPANGIYNTFIVDAAYVNVSAIPEPSTYAALAGAAMLGLAIWQRRRRT